MIAQPLPKCPDERLDCAFIQGSAHTTSLHSPVVYNRSGEPIGGGSNTHTLVLHCQSCGRNWTCKQSVLEALQLKPVTWVTK